jgi:hypothetical protein
MSLNAADREFWLGKRSQFFTGANNQTLSVAEPM